MNNKKYLIILTETVPLYMALEDCPACDGSGKVDPNATLGGRPAGGGVCPICRGDKTVSTTIDPETIPGELLERLNAQLSEFVPDEDLDALERQEEVEKRRKAGM